MIRMSGGASRLLTPAVISALVLAGCSSQPESAGSAAPAPREEAPPAQGTSTAAVVSGIVPTTGTGAPSLVILTPREPRELPPAAEPPVMDQAQLTFFPSVLFVRTHQPTEFRNSDPEMHNVRVREEATKEGTFNVAIPTGESYQHTFERDGFYDVGCDIHPGMSAMIVATSTPYTAVADREGRFSISGVPPGAYTASVQVGKQRFERQIEVGGGRVEIDFSDAIGTQES